MQNGSQDEQDTCRICSAPAEPDAPLFHPCKCSGTIRYIHQDCLTTWLSHSKKKTCDVCKYQYSFTKVYAPDMPNEIPFILFLRKFAEQVFWGFVMILRALVVATMWLAFLPYVTVWTWRFYFVMGENIAWWINDRPRPPAPSIFETYYANVTLSDTSNKTVNASFTTYPVWRTLSSDIFTGQIIASLIVLAFLGIFLLREWILQNARPGVFEDDELLENEPQPPAAQQVLERAARVEERLRQLNIDGLQDALDDMRRAIEDGRRAVDALQPDDVEEAEPSPDAMLVLDTDERQHIVPSDSEAVEEEGDNMNERRHQKRRLHQSDEEHRANRRLRTSAKPRERSVRRSAKGKERAHSEPAPSPSPEEDAGSSKSFEFTFTVDRSSPSSFENNTPGSSSPFSVINIDDSYQTDIQSVPSTPLSDTSALDRPGPSSHPRRPALPSSSRPTPDILSTDSDDNGYFVTPPTRSSSLSSRGGSEPLPSPQITTFKAPEDLQGGGEQTLNDDHNPAQPDSSTAAFSQEDIDTFFQDASEESDAEDDEQERGQNYMGHIDLPAVVDAPRPEGGINGAFPPEIFPPPPPAENGAAQDGVGDPDALNDDDVDGALEEAIGMRGPITTVFQNAALMIFILDTTIGLGVWLPFMIGKTSALLSLEPIRLLQILHLPIKLIRYVTDPAVDLCFFVIGYITLPFVTLFRNFRQLVPAPEMSTTDSSPAKDIYSINLRSILDFPAKLTKSSTEDSVINRGIVHISRSPVGQFLEPYLVSLGRWVRLHSVGMKAAWVELATKDGSMNRIFAVALGYLIVAILVALYLNVLNVGNVRNAGKAIRNAIRQQLVVLKVATFIVIELVVFPLGCGIMLDLCTLKLFPSATLRSRMEFFLHAPVTAGFYHWMVGTMFMYQFAVILAGCRKIIRPGAMWFIRDPQDQNFHPIRDILDRPTLVQLKKLAVSAVMYSVVVALGMGCLIFCLRLWGQTLLPLRWKLRDPLSDVPVDLLVLHLAIPPTIHHFRPRKSVRNLITRYWKWAARQLRLTSYMFGGLPADEMVPSKSFTAWLKSVWSEDPKESESDQAAFDGSYRRVPSVDNIALPRDIGATVKVDKDGTPLEDAGRRLMELQDSEAERARRNVKKDYTIVYLPPRFRERVIIFVLSLWMLATLLFVTALALPLHLGRAVFRTVLGREVHDGYSIVVGFYLLWGCYIFGKTLDRIDKRRQRNNRDELRGDIAVYLFKYFTLQALNLTWVAFWLGFVIPTLLALVVELYLVHPLRLIINPELTLKIRIIDSWAVGLLYMKLVLSVRRRMRSTTSVDTAIRRLRDDGIKRLSVVAATLDIIIPVTLGLLACLLLPIAIVLPLQHLLPNYISPKALFLYVYPGLFVLAGIAKVYDALQVVAQSWAQQIRDSEFLVEMRLKNLDPPPNPNSSEKPSLSRSPSATTATPMEATPSSSTISINQPEPET